MTRRPFPEALTRLMNDRFELTRLGAAAAKRMDENFIADRMAGEFEKAYAELAAVPRRQLSWSQSVRSLAAPYSKLVRSRPQPQERYAS